MTTYTDEVNVYNPEAIASGIADAGETATNYLTVVDQTGLMVHPSTDSTTGWKISSAIELLKSGVSYIKLWLEGTPAVAKLRLGLESAGHAIFSSNGMELYTDSTTKTGAFTSEGVVIGKSDGSKFFADESSIALYSQDAEKVFSVEIGSTASTIGYIGRLEVASGQSVNSVSVSSGYSIPNFLNVMVDGTSVSYSTQAMSSSETLPDGTTVVTTRRAVAHLASAVSGPATIVYSYTVSEPPVTAVLGRKNGNHVEVATSGVDVFTDGTTSVAKFGNTVRLGTTSGYNIKLNGDNGRISLNSGSNQILSLQKMASTDTQGILSFGNAEIFGGGDSNTNIYCDVSAGNTGVSDSKASQVYVRLSAQTSTNYNDFKITASGSATLSSGLSISGDLYVDDITTRTSKTANTVLAAPNGSAGSPSFRSLVAADLPTVTVAKGGTGKTSLTAYQPICGGTTTTGALQSVSSTNTGAMYRTSTTALPVWGTLPVAQGGTAKTSGAFHSCTQLYNSTTGSNGTITLSAAVTNYDYLAIWTIDNNSKNPRISWIATRKAATTSTVMMFEASSNTGTLFRRVLYTISGTSMTPSYGNYIQNTAPSTWSSGTAGTNYVKVTRVMGYII